MNIFICGLDDMRQFHGQVTHILSIVDPEDVGYVLTLGVPPERQLVLCCHDVESIAEAQAREKEMPGSKWIVPTREVVQEALRFARDLSESDSLLVHCSFGISRSTALVFAILCQAQPDLVEVEVLAQVIMLRPQASPNALIVKHADALLQRAGRMDKVVRDFTQREGDSSRFGQG